MAEEPQRPENKPAKTISGTSLLKPEQYDPEMAAAALANNLVDRLGTPSIVSKKFVVYLGIWEALNHTPENPTGYDSSLRIAVYKKVGGQSVNVDGKYFDSLFTYLNKPKFVMSGLMQPGQFEKPEPGFVEKAMNFIRGKKTEEPK